MARFDTLSGNLVAPFALLFGIFAIIATLAFENSWLSLGELFARISIYALIAGLVLQLIYYGISFIRHKSL